jgi:hypothetical protein
VSVSTPFTLRTAADPVSETLCSFQMLSHTRKKKRLLASSCLYVCPSVPMYQLGSHWIAFREVWYLRLSWKLFDKNTYFGKNLSKILGTLHEHLSTFYCCRQQTRYKNIVDIDICMSTILRERTVAAHIFLPKEHSTVELICPRLRFWLVTRMRHNATLYVHCASYFE